MGRPRRKKIVPRPAGRKRDYAAEYARRQARARAAGFESYYDRRVRGGRAATPSTPRPSGDLLQRARGHAGRAGLLAYIQPGDIVMLDRHVKDHDRDERGRWRRIGKEVHPDDPSRPVRRFQLFNVSDAQLARLIDAELARGANMTLIPSLDQQRLLRNDARAA